MLKLKGYYSICEDENLRKLINYSINMCPRCVSHYGLAIEHFKNYLLRQKKILWKFKKNCHAKT
jgi:hypothetical protein